MKKVFIIIFSLLTTPAVAEVYAEIGFMMTDSSYIGRYDSYRCEHSVNGDCFIYKQNIKEIQNPIGMIEIGLQEDKHRLFFMHISSIPDGEDNAGMNMIGYKYRFTLFK